MDTWLISPYPQPTLIHRATRGILGGKLSGVGRRLARTLEADLAGRAGRNHSACRIGDRNDGVVEGGLDVGLTHGDIATFLAARTTRGGSAGLRCASESVRQR